MGSLAWLRNIRYVLFDWGGTLCRADGENDAIGKGIEAVAGRLRIDPAAQASVAASLTRALQGAYSHCDSDPEHREIDVREVVSRWGDQMGFSHKRDWNLDGMVETIWQHWQGCLELLDEPLPVLTELRRRGFALALLSNVAASSKVCHAELQRLGLLDHLQSCTFSSELGLRKPHKRVFAEAVSRLGRGDRIDPQSMVYVGDSPRWDVGGAKTFGMCAVLFRSQASSWPEEDYETYRPDAIIDKLGELLILLPRKAATES